MKIQIDTIQKKIILQEEVNLSDFFDAIQNFLPDGLWKEFKLEINVINNWINPINIPYTPIYPTSPNPFPLQPSWPPICPASPNYPWITYCSTGVNDSGVTFTSSLNAGTYNVEFAIGN